jgi:hypothetical protein
MAAFSESTAATRRLRDRQINQSRGALQIISHESLHFF